MSTHTLPIGDFLLTSIPIWPGRMMNPSQLFQNQTLDEIDDARAKFPYYFGETNQELKFTLNAFLLRGPHGNVLIDTGVPSETQPSPLLVGLEEVGLSPDDIHFVVFTHRDGDHVGGGTVDGRPAFPRARYFIGHTEYEHFRADQSRAETFANHITPLETAGLLEVVANDAEIVPEVHLYLTPGHRSGATSVTVNRRTTHHGAIILADTWHSAIQVTLPDWHMMFDEDGHAASATRRQVIEMAERDDLLVAVPHTIDHGFGKVRRDEHGYKWDPFT